MAYPSEAVEAQGTILRVKNTATPAVFVMIGEIKNFSGPGGSASVIDVSTLQSQRREKRMGLPDEGQLTFSGNRVFTDAGQQVFRAARSARRKAEFELEYPDGTVDSFEGFALEFSTQGGVDGVIEFSATIEITGEVTEA